MRETCLRVLAAGLMTGSIAAVVGMSALFGMPSAPGRPIAAPPSSLQRAVRIHVAPAPPQRRSVERIRITHRVTRPARPAALVRRLVIIHTRPPRRRLAWTKHKVTPVAPAVTPAAPATPAATPPAEPVQVQVPQPAASAEDDEADKDNNGHAYGHDKEHGQGHEKHEE
jgi:hypothetical protein